MTNLIAATTSTPASGTSQTGRASSDGVDFARELESAQQQASTTDRSQQARDADRASARRDDAQRQDAARREDAADRRADAARRNEAARKDEARRADAADRAEDSSGADDADRADARDDLETDAVDEPVDERVDESLDADDTDTADKPVNVEQTAMRPVVPATASTDAGAVMPDAAAEAADGETGAIVAEAQPEDGSASQTEVTSADPEASRTGAEPAAARAGAGDRAEAAPKASSPSHSAQPVEEGGAPTSLSSTGEQSADAQGEQAPQRPASLTPASAMSTATEAADDAAIARSIEPDAEVRPAAQATTSTTSADASSTQVAAPAATVTPATAAASSASASSSTAQAAPPLATQLTGQLAQLKQLPQGEHVLTLSITPETFGQVKVVAHITQDGVSVQLFGASDASREALRQALGDLRRDLAATGLTADLDLGTEQGPQGELADQGTGLGSRRGSQQPTSTIRIDGPQPLTPATAMTSGTHAGGVDLMI
ncbi:flagellar hook-length control protein FliK [Demequina sp. NBRC 110054]|uniref:flagellar hook-length control protein FliK n=1 Tax=Demequina sp. NBRC 110054 TaxID=1570343 RepID=UPI000A006A17|nr:flagellar hook-length control protein FliK [Demequina sp. NBRC 110054]